MLCSNLIINLYHSFSPFYWFGALEQKPKRVRLKKLMMSYYHYENGFGVMDSLEGLIDPLGSLVHNLQSTSTRLKVWLCKQAAVG